MVAFSLDPDPNTAAPKQNRSRRTIRQESQDFATFYEAYPRKVARANACKAWEQTESDRPPLAQLLTILDHQCRQPDWIKDGGKFIPHPATWLRGKRWTDDLDPQINRSRPGQQDFRKYL